VIAKREIAARLLDRSGLGRVCDHLPGRRGLVALGYHRIGNPEATLLDRGMFSATAEEFDAQLRYLKSSTDVIGLDDVETVLRGKRGRAVLLTFDDGYRDNYEVALPLLRAHGVPATFFLTTGFLDRPTVPWWDLISWMVRSTRQSDLELPRWVRWKRSLGQRDQDCTILALVTRCKSLPHQARAEFLGDLEAALEVDSREAERQFAGTLWMTWDMARAAKAAGMDLGAHTVSHPSLVHLCRQRQLEEIVECARRVREETGEAPRALSYPFGGLDRVNADTRACLREAGIPLCFSYYGGYNHPNGVDRFDLRRIRLSRLGSLDAFKFVVRLPYLSPTKD
jgi:peptidoglycan/xylan/chitin deacetylase (PgdA/CDA1 family)